MIGGFDFDVVFRSLSYVLITGLGFTLGLTAFATVGGICLGTLLALVRLSDVAGLRVLVAGYVNLMRSLPLLLVLFWFYFLVPYLGQWLTGAERPVQVGPVWSAMITFMLFEAAYFAEIIRAGIQSTPKGQLQAAFAIGLTYSQAMAYVVIPQVLRKMAPVLLTQTIILFQDTSIVYVLSLTDLIGAASKVAQRDGRIIEMYLFAAAVYLFVSLCLSQLVRHLQAKHAKA